MSKRKPTSLREASFARMCKVVGSKDTSLRRYRLEDRLGYLVTLFDSQVVPSGVDSWIRNRFWLRDQALLDALEGLSTPLHKPIASIVQKVDKIATRADALESRRESARTNAALARLAERCAALDEAYSALREKFLAAVEAELVQMNTPQRGRRRS